MIPISAIVLTKNEEKNLPDCLACLTWANEILVVDSFSTDRTMEIAERLATRVVQHPFSNFAAQRNFAQSQAKNDWVLFVDADERIPPELRDEILDLARTEELLKCNAYYINRMALFSGRWLPEKGKLSFLPDLTRTIRPKGDARLLDRRQAVWRRPLHEEVDVPEPYGILINQMRHYALTNLSLAYESFNWYTDLDAAYLHRSSTRSRAGILGAIVRGIRNFAYHYVYCGWFLKGEQGFLLASFLAYMKFVTYAKLSERLRIQKGIGDWTEQDRKLLEPLQLQGELLAETTEGIQS